jgi:hypothetical protein
MTMKKSALFLTVCLPLLASAASTIAATAVTSANADSAVDRKALERALGEHLRQRGDLCVGKFEWPIDVAAGDADAGSRDAIQLPVLEKLGLVEATAGSVVRKNADGEEQAVPVRRYALTPAGRQFYVNRPRQTLTPQGERIERPGDFCAARLGLKTLVAWTPPRQVGDVRELTATYTYTVSAPAWTGDTEVRRVFPMVAHIVDGAGKLQLKQRLRLVGKTWTAVDL